LLFRHLKNKIYKTILGLVVLYWRGTWSLTLRDNSRLRLCENMVLRRIFGPKRDEATWTWIKLYNKEPNDLCSSPSIVRVIKSRRMSWASM